MQFRNRLFALLFFVYIPHSVFSQFAAVTVERNSILYAGIKNPLSIVAENTPCNSLIIKTTHGSVTGKDCRYIFQIDFDTVSANKIYYTDILVYKKIRGKLKLLAKWIYRIKNIPDPVALLLPQLSQRKEFSDFLKSRKTKARKTRIIKKSKVLQDQ